MKLIIKYGLRVWPYFLVLFLAYWSYSALLTPGFFPVHDDTQVARVHEMAKALSDGQVPVRWVSDLGYGFGYPLYNFYAPLPYYFGGIMDIAGFDAVLATKLMFLFGVVMASLTMFCLGRSLYGTWGGVLASVFYTYAPYRALDIYVRGAVGEFWAIAFLPLFFLGVYALTTRKISRINLLITSLSLAAIILSHNITGMLVAGGFVVFIILYFINLLKIGKIFSPDTSFRILLLALVIALSISAFFWLPALVERDFTSVSFLTTDGVDYHHHFVYPDQLWDSPWGYGGSASGRADGLSFKIGKLPLVLAVVGLFASLLQRREKSARKLMVPALFLITLVAAFMSLPISLPIWEHVPVLAFVQFPWRFLLFVAFGVSFISASLVSLFRRYQVALVMFLSFLTILYNTKYFVPKYFESKSEENYTNIEEMQWRVSKVSDEYLPRFFVRPKVLSEIRGDRFIDGSNLQIVQNLGQSSQHFAAIVKNSQAQNVTLALTDFPGWRVFVDGIQVKTFDNEGKISFFLPAGEMKVAAIFADTPIRTVGNIMSVIGMVSLFAIYVQKKTTS